MTGLSMQLKIAPWLRGIFATEVGPAAVTIAPVNQPDYFGGAQVEYSDATLVLDPDRELTAVDLTQLVVQHRAKYGISPTRVLLPGVATFTVGPPISPEGRLGGKIVVVTGGAQGFGLGIAEELISLGACIVLADANYPLAADNAARLRGEYGQRRAHAISMNVMSEESCQDAIVEIVNYYGGIDLFVSNAGVLRAESVLTQPVADFDLVTNVNYRGYFLGVRAVSPVMAAQRETDLDRWLDIIEVNSKSGLVGSKRNFAYAGSKFGGIGLTQSFALELVEFGIKVNAVCPGNYLDGPLWTDPERGLFVQYLNAGKIPGATSVAAVREFYEAKVPMRRGCLPSDLVKAIVYLTEQDYETGQALPVTGGQNMLN